jgi:hypothetical protein
MIQIKGGLYSVILAITLLNTNINNAFKSKNSNYTIKQLGYQKTDSLDYFAENGFGKPVQSIQHPMGEYYKGVTYVAYQGPHEDPYVCSYNHKTKAWKGPFKAGISALGKTPISTDPTKIDNHGKPALLVDTEGYIHLIFGGHGGNLSLGINSLGTIGRGEMMHVVSKKPFDISDWEELKNISPLGTYSQWVKTRNGTIYLFYRHGSHRSNWVYQKSTDNARTFAAPVSILKYKKTIDKALTYDSWYAWFQEGADNSIVSTFNYHLCGTGPGHSSLRLNSYFMKMNTETETWETISGEKLKMPLTKESADEFVKIHDSNGKKTQLGTIQSNIYGDPHLYFKSKGSFFYANWQKDKWNLIKVNDAEFNLGDADISIEKENEIKFLATTSTNNTDEIAWWDTKDKGQSWIQETPMITSKSGKYVMSSLIRNAHPDARVIVAEIPNIPMAVDSKMYLIGDHGPVRR